MLGFAALAVVAMIAIKFFFGIFGIIISLIGALLWFAFVGFLIYLALRVLSPSTADRVKEMISGKPAV
jgi:predicted lipid-binding transport protein (Tim44 family)